MSARKSPRVLVIDDEPELRQILAESLRGLDLEVVSAGSGKEALGSIAQRQPDLVVADLALGDCSGLDILDHLHDTVGDVPAVVITGHGDVRTLAEASRRNVLELMTKPLDLQRLRTTVSDELSRQADVRRSRGRTRKLRSLARDSNLQRKQMQRQLNSTCTDLAEAYKSLSKQMAVQQLALGYQRDLLAARNDDDVFRSLFRLFVRQTGPVFGVALVCDANAELQTAGRFGAPAPDGPGFCEAICRPMIESVLQNPRLTHMEAGDQADQFPPKIRKYLAGLSILAVPLLPAAQEMIGLVVLYRKGEQPFAEEDLALAEMISLPTAIAVKRND